MNGHDRVPLQVRRTKNADGTSFPIRPQGGFKYLARVGAGITGVPLCASCQKPICPIYALSVEEAAEAQREAQVYKDCAYLPVSGRQVQKWFGAHPRHTPARIVTYQHTRDRHPCQAQGPWPEGEH